MRAVFRLSYTKRNDHCAGGRRIAIVLLLAVFMAVAGTAAAQQTNAVVEVWESGGLSLITVEGVAVAARTQNATIHVRRSGSLRLMGVTRDGADVQRPDPGFGYPMATLAVESDDPLLPAARGLGPATVLMSERSAALRGARPGDVVEIEGWNRDVLRFEIARVVPDEELDWYEIVLSDAGAERLGLDRDASLVVEGPNAAALLSAVRWMVRSPAVRVSTPDEPIEFSDSTLPTVIVKERFGEFAFRPSGRADGIEIEESWLDANIVDAYVEELGPFRCNRAIMPYLRSAIADLRSQGTIDEIDFNDFQIAGGCFNARMMRGGDKGFALSRHAWGIAIDFNPSSNPYGGPTELSPAFGDTFRDWGFAWGATWTVPDGMHFEWTGAPEVIETCARVRLVEPTSSSVTWSVQEAQDETCSVG